MRLCVQRREFMAALGGAAAWPIAARAQQVGATMTVIGSGAVRITDAADHDGMPYYVLKPGARFDLASWRAL